MSLSDLESVFKKYDNACNGYILDHNVKLIFDNLNPIDVIPNIKKLCFENESEMNYHKMIDFLRYRDERNDYEKIQIALLVYIYYIYYK